MKKLLCIALSAIITVSAFAAVPAGSFAASSAKKAVSLKKKSATLKIKTENGKKTYGSTTIKLKKAKGVSVKKVTYKSSSKKVATVSKKGKVTAKKEGKAKITVKVKYKYKKKAKTKSLTFKVTVKDVIKHYVGPYPPIPDEEPTEPFSDPAATPLNTLPEVESKTGCFTDAAFLKKLSDFSNKLYVMTAENVDGNYSMSPISVYMALSMLYSVGDEGVKDDIESLVGMNSEEFAKTGELFVSLLNKYSYMGKTVRTLNLTNSVWLDDGEKVNSEALASLAKDFYCSAFQTPFKNNNAAANNALRKFIKHQTNGLIDQNFELDPTTLFALVNTLYFKDVWDLDREELSTEKKNFKTPEGDKKCEFLIGKYIPGQVAENDVASYFYTTTSGKYKVKFILPKDGHTLDEAMTAENLNAVNNQTDFKDTEGLTEHKTRCIFPSFKIESETPLKDILAKNGALPHAFTSYFSPLSDKELCVSEIKHKVVLDVSKTGVEGAAVTIIASKANSIAPTKQIVYHDFLIDKGFGFIVTDPSDVVLFEGKVTNP